MHSFFGNQFLILFSCLEGPKILENGTVRTNSKEWKPDQASFYIDTLDRCINKNAFAGLRVFCSLLYCDLLHSVCCFRAISSNLRKRKHYSMALVHSPLLSRIPSLNVWIESREKINILRLVRFARVAAPTCTHVLTFASLAFPFFNYLQYHLQKYTIHYTTYTTCTTCTTYNTVLYYVLVFLLHTHNEKRKRKNFLVHLYFR